MLNITFFGTDIFAKIILEKLIENFNVSLIITKPDEKVGRKQILEESKISKFAKEHNIKCLKPIKLKDIKQNLENNNSDIFIVAEYGKIIPKEILNIPKYGSLNIHGSILPQYRGAAPIQYSLLNGDKTTGITIIKMDKEMDHGDIVKMAEIKIENNDDQIILREKLAKVGAETLINLLKQKPISLNAKEQDHNKATYTKLIEKNDGQVDLKNDTAEKIIAKFKAYKPWPGIFIIKNEKRIKLIDINYEINKLETTDNVINNFVIKNKELFIKSADNNLIKINKLQLEGKNEISGKDYINQLKNPAI